MRHLESKLQQHCIQYFDYKYPSMHKLLFAVPNGGKRSIKTAMILKSEGVRAGVADLMLTVARHGYHGLFIEMKYGKGTQEDSQKEFQAAVEAQGYKYIVCRSFDQFQEEIKNYLS